MKKKFLIILFVLVVIFLLTRNSSSFGSNGLKTIESKLSDQNDSTTETKVNKSDITDDTVLIFHATWCGYCKQAMSKFKDAVAQSKGKVILVDADKNRDLVDEYGIEGFPTIIKGDKTKYDGTRETADILEFANS